MGFFKKNTSPEKAPEVQSESAATDIVANDDVLIAVFAAAIAASAGRASPSNLTVRKISRIAGQTNAWNSAGRLECIDSRRV